MPRKTDERNTKNLANSVFEWLKGLDPQAAARLGDRGSLSFWLAWAKHVLRSHGVDPSWRGMTLGEILRDGDAQTDGGWSAAYASVAALRAAARPHTPEWHAATLQLEEMTRTPSDGYDDGSATDRIMMVVGRLRAQVVEDRLVPDALIGRNLRVRNRRAAANGVEQRRENSQKTTDRIQQAVAGYRRGDPDASRRQMARDLSPRLKLGVGALLGRLRRLGL